MRFTFDPNKRKTNFLKHGLDMALAISMRAQVILHPDSVLFADHRFPYDEERFITIGPLRSTIAVVATAEDAHTIRILSMRRATPHEQTIYYESKGR